MKKYFVKSVGTLIYTEQKCVGLLRLKKCVEVLKAFYVVVAGFFSGGALLVSL